MGVTLLGVVAARTPEGTVPIAGGKQQALLALLALGVPRPVSTDRLIDEIWGDDPPANPDNALQAQVSQLRRVMGRDAVVREPTGYRLAVEPDEVDVVRLEALVRAGQELVDGGDHGAAGESFSAALDLALGPPLPELSDFGFARDAAVRLEELVLAAHEGFVDSELAAGHHGAVVERLRALVLERPLRERFHAQLITALYRSGRQAEALRAYQAVRDVLADELGLDPGPELQALERAVLSQDPSLAAPVRLTSAAPQAKLPVARTSFVGRADELALVDERLAGERLVTLVGPAGVGKTRLALEAATRLGSGREVWFVELAPVTDPVAVPEAIAAGVGAREDAPTGEGAEGIPPGVRAAERVGDRPVVVVLDNCEHVIDAAADFVSPWLDACRELTVLATSREPLAIDGESQVAVEPLRVDEAIDLFGQRARAVQPGFGAHPAVGELCERLDGLPLAIELAAARAKTLPVPQIIARLEDRFQLLTATGRSGPHRHRALGAAIATSYDTLYEGERDAFCRLAVFAGGVTVDAAIEIIGDDALDILARLVDRSLVIADTSGAESRFRMLESIRAFGLDRLAADGKLAEATAAHLAWCTRLAATVQDRCRFADQLTWLRRLDAEHDNVRAALARAVDDDPDAAVTLTGYLVLPWWFRGRRQEARHWTDAALAAAREPVTEDLARALGYIGLITESAGWTGAPGAAEEELALAQERQREALRLMADQPGTSLYAELELCLIATLGRMMGTGRAIDVPELEALIESAYATFRGQGNEYGMSMARGMEAVVASAMGDELTMATAVEGARHHADRNRDRFSLSRAEWLLSLQAQMAGDLTTAYRHAEASLRHADELGMSQAVTSTGRLLARLAEQSGDDDLARQWHAFVEGRGGRWAFYQGSMVAAARNAAARSARARGDLERAAVEHEEALDLFRQAGMTAGIATTTSHLGFLATAADDPERAARLHREALPLAIEADDGTALALALEGLASVADDQRWAAALLGAAATLWASETYNPPPNREDVRAAEDLLRDALGDDYQAARAEGAALSRDEAVAIARLGHLA